MLKLSYANCLSDRVGEHGLDPAHIDAGSEGAEAAVANTKKLASTRGKGWERWRELPFDPMRRDHVNGVKALAERCRGKFENMIVLGIGGSALGNIALQTALNPPTYNLLDSGKRPGPRCFVVDNVDPAHFGAVLDFCRSQPGGIQKTLFNIISKSGETAETAAQFMIVRDELRKAIGTNYAPNIVAITDADKGTMRQICDREGYATLPVPDGVGGRFSVLSPVGLFSAAMCGIDIDSLLTGAADMDKVCSREDIAANPASMLATLLVELGQTKGKINHVLMPYSNALYSLADWFRQLWAESLGKRLTLTGKSLSTGFTPIKALGTTDQHSQIQLYREGPNDKVIGLVEIENFDEHPRGVHGDVRIPSGLNVEALHYLENRTMGELIAAEKRATEYSLVESQRPNFTISLPRLDAYHVGQFIWLWQMTTAYAGLMLNIDAYDQPAVELGKQATFGLMGKKGFENFRAKVDSVLSASTRVIAG